MNKLQTAQASTKIDLITIEWTLSTRCELQQLVSLAMRTIITVTEGEICNLILLYFHTAEYASTENKIVIHNMIHLRQEFKIAKPYNQDLQPIQSHVDRIPCGEQIQVAMKECEKK
jgi:hypothetical protein